MKASYKDSMQNVVFGESEKTKIRRVILDATVPVKQHSNILHWKYVVVIAALFLAGAGIYKSVKLNWENEQYGQYEFEIAASDYRTPKENVSNDFLQDAKERATVIIQISIIMALLMQLEFIRRLQAIHAIAQ